VPFGHVRAVVGDIELVRLGKIDRARRGDVDHGEVVAGDVAVVRELLIELVIEPADPALD
jgi:hypothetical protein